MIKTNKIRAYFARFLLPILTVWLCVLPSTSYAFIPSGLGLVLEGGGAGGGSIVVDAAAAGAATAGGAAVIATAGVALMVGMAAGYAVVGSLTDGYVRVPLVADSVKGAIPAPAATPPFVTPAHTQYSSDGTNYVDTFCAAVTIREAYRNSIFNNTETVVACRELVTQADVQVCNPSCYTYVNFLTSSSFNSRTVQNSCPAGSTISGTAPNQTCVVNDSRQLVQDKRLDYGRTGSAYFAPASTDKDQGQNLTGKILAADGHLQVTGKDDKSYTVIYDFYPRADGGSDVVISKTYCGSVAQCGITQSYFTVHSSGTVKLRKLRMNGALLVTMFAVKICLSFLLMRLVVFVICKILLTLNALQLV